MTDQHRDRYLMALYYAYGRTDGYSDEKHLEPIAFAEHYTATWDEFQRGECSYMPAVQEQWRRWKNAQA